MLPALPLDGTSFGVGGAGLQALYGANLTLPVVSMSRSLSPAPNLLTFPYFLKFIGFQRNESNLLNDISVLLDFTRTLLLPNHRVHL